MADLVTTAELNVFLDDTVDEDISALAIGLAQGLVREACHWDISQTEDEELLLDGNGATSLLLPRLKVTAVSIVEDPAGDATDLVEGDDFEFSETGILRRRDNGRWCNRFRWYATTVTSGYPDGAVPSTVRTIVLRFAREVVQNPAGLRQEAIGRYSYTAAAEVLGIRLGDADLRDLGPWIVRT